MNIQDNIPQQQAFRLIAETNSSFFLTGRAGTGKTTFLREIQKEVNKNFIVLAPTGVAAILAEGSTIHSFFGFPLEVLTPQSVGRCRINNAKRELIRRVDTIIVDEVSMVRCDMVDMMDLVLRIITKCYRPFGGKQMVFVGDMQQLPPVVSKDVDREVLLQNYNTIQPFFFKAHVFSQMRLPAIEFEKIYRQDDQAFLSVLNHIRDGVATSQELQLLNSHVDPSVENDHSAMVITPYNMRVNAINSRCLDEIAKPARTYEGKFTGSFKENAAPVEVNITLKEGAQVMLCRNDSQRRWANGTLAKVCSMKENEVEVELSDGKRYVVAPVEWEEYEYSYDKQTDSVKKKPVGTFRQLPLRLAWAITIHRSQGSTFERMHLDVSQGVNAEGQLYVALSRVKSLQGLTLQSPITPSMIRTNNEVRRFSENYNNETIISSELNYGAALRTYLQKGDIDGATAMRLNLALAEAQKGEAREAAYILGQMTDLMIADDHLQGSIKAFTPMESNSTSAQFANAVFSLYAGQYEESEAYLQAVLTARPNCEAAHFIRFRLHTLWGNYQEADREANLIYKQFGDNDRNTWAIALNNSHIGDPVLPYIESVLNNHKGYIPALAHIRQEMFNQNITLEEADPLTPMFNDKQVADTEFRQTLSSATDKERLQLTEAILKQLFINKK